MEPRSSSPPPNGVANAPEPRSSSSPPNGAANAPETRPPSPPPQGRCIGYGPRYDLSSPGVGPIVYGPLSLSPPCPRNQVATEPGPTDHEPWQNDTDRPVPVKCKGNEREWNFRISREPLQPDASHEVFMAAWRQSATPRGILRKVDREEVRLLKVARVRAALHAINLDDRTAADGWCSKNVDVHNSTAQKAYQKVLEVDENGSRRLRHHFTTKAFMPHVMRPVAIYETDGRVHVIYVVFEACMLRHIRERETAWMRSSWRTIVDFDSDGLFKRIESVRLAKAEVFKGDNEEMMKFANRVEEIKCADFDY